MGILVVGAAFVDIKGYPHDRYLPTGRNVGSIKYIHGGVARNVVEDIANVELRPTYLGMVDDTPLGSDVKEKLRKHKVNVDYVLTRPDGMGTWMVIFDNSGDVAGSISKRADMMPLLEVLEEKGDEIVSNADSIVVQVDLDKELLKKILELAKKYNKKTYALVSNMQIAAKRRDLIKYFDCFICNEEEAGIFFIDEYEHLELEEMREILAKKVVDSKIPLMVVTMGSKGAVYATMEGDSGAVKAKKVQVKDTTGAGDAFCAGLAIGLTYGKSIRESVEIGSTLAASVIVSSDNVCPRFTPEEFGLDVVMEESDGNC